MNSINNQQCQSSSELINKLPVEILELILEYLNIRDLLNLRKVSSSFRNLVKEFRIRGIDFFTETPCNSFDSRFIERQCSQFNIYSNINPFILKRSFIEKPISRVNIYSDINPFILKRSFINFCYLTHFSMSVRWHYSGPKFTLNDLNEFLNLKLLEIHFNNIERIKNKRLLSLPNLEVLVLESNFGDVKMELDLPKCRKLYFDCVFSSLKFNHPSSITHIINRRSDEMIYGLTNLEYYACLHYLDSEMLSNLLLDSPNLSIVDLGFQICDNKIFRIKLLKPNLKIYYRGFELDSENDFNQYSNSSQMIANYTKNNQYFWNTFETFHYELLNYTRSMPNFVLNNFLEKFWNIEKIYASSVIEDQNELILLINKCRCLHTLRLTNSMLPQTFFDLLPSISSLFMLIIEDDEVRKLNPGFLERMFQLRKFKTRNELIMDEQLNLNTLLDKDLIEFRFGDQLIQIQKKGKDLYEFEMKSESFQVNLDRLIKLFDNLEKSIKLVDNLNGSNVRIITRSMTRSRKRTLDDFFERESKKQKLV